jgi:hypothetical protein
MTRARWVFFAVVLSIGAFASLVTRPAADAPVPAGIAPWVEYARERASDPRGVVGLLWPLRFVEARCTLDPVSVVLVFEAANPSMRAYAAIGFPAASEVDIPGAATVIGSITSDEFAVAMARGTYGACA